MSLPPNLTFFQINKEVQEHPKLHQNSGINVCFPLICDLLSVVGGLGILYVDIG